MKKEQKAQGLTDVADKALDTIKRHGLCISRCAGSFVSFLHPLYGKAHASTKRKIFPFPDRRDAG
jgi:hypothetical protein